MENIFLNLRIVGYLIALSLLGAGCGEPGNQPDPANQLATSFPLVQHNPSSLLPNPTNDLSTEDTPINKQKMEVEEVEWFVDSTHTLTTNAPAVSDSRNNDNKKRNFNELDATEGSEPSGKHSRLTMNQEQGNFVVVNNSINNNSINNKLNSCASNVSGGYFGQQLTHITHIHADVMIYIASYLRLEDVLNMRRVCKQWNELSQNPKFTNTLAPILKATIDFSKPLPIGKVQNWRNVPYVPQFAQIFKSIKNIPSHLVSYLYDLQNASALYFEGHSSESVIKTLQGISKSKTSYTQIDTLKINLHKEKDANINHLLRVLERALAKLPNLKTSFSLPSCFLTPKEIELLIKLLQDNTTLQKLDLSGNHIEEEGAIAIAQALETNTTLQQLDLSECSIEDEGAIAIAQALETNTTLQQLDLNLNHIEEEGAIAIAQALETNTTLQQLNLSANKNITDEGAIAIAQALETNTTLQQLNLSYNYIEDEGAIAIAQALATNTTLQQLDLTGNSIENDLGVTDDRMEYTLM